MFLFTIFLRFLINENNNTIINCNFESNLVSDNGGAISCSTSSEIQILISYCLFFNCKTTSFYGGAIYLKLLSFSNIEIKNCCGNTCFTGLNQLGQFFFIESISKTTILFEYNSILYCPKDYILTNQVLSFYDSYQIINLINSSNNNLDAASGGFFSTTNKSFISFTTFFNCTNKGRSIGLDNTGKSYIKFSNIIKNLCGNIQVIRRFSNGISYIENCIFYDNNGLFYIDTQGFLYIINCWSNFYSHSGIGYISYQNTQSITSTFKINFFSTIYCNNILISKKNLKKYNLLFLILIILFLK